MDEDVTGTYRCEKCSHHKLNEDDYWETNYSLNQVNDFMHMKCLSSLYLGKYGANCRGCLSLGRRHVKVLVNLLFKVGVLG